MYYSIPFCCAQRANENNYRFDSIQRKFGSISLLYIARYTKNDNRSGNYAKISPVRTSQRVSLWDAKIFQCNLVYCSFLVFKANGFVFGRFLDSCMVHGGYRQV